MKVSDLMSRRFACVTPQATCQKAAGKMLEESVQVLPVVDANEKLVGIVRGCDILEQLDLIKQYDFIPVTIAHVMNHEPVSVDEDAELITVIDMFLYYELLMLPVVKYEKITGVISYSEIMKAFILEHEPGITLN